LTTKKQKVANRNELFASKKAEEVKVRAANIIPLILHNIENTK